jgi:transposase
MPTPYPEEFRRDVIAVAREGGRSRAQVARSFGISESCLARWLRIADREDGIDEAPPSAAAAGEDLSASSAPTPTSKHCAQPGCTDRWAGRRLR